MEAYEIGLAIAKANRHPAPEDYAEAVERASQGKDPYVLSDEELAAQTQAEPTPL